MKAYSYEDCRDIVRGWGLEKLTRLISLHTEIVAELKRKGVEGELQTQENFVLAMEHELRDQCDLVDREHFDLNAQGGMKA